MQPRQKDLTDELHIRHACEVILAAAGSNHRKSK